MARLTYFNVEDSKLIKDAFASTVPNDRLLTMCQDLMYSEAERAKFLAGSFNFGKRVLANGLTTKDYALSSILDKQRGDNFIYGNFNERMLADFEMTSTHAGTDKIGVRSLVDRGLNNCFGNDVELMSEWYCREDLRVQDFAIKMVHEDGAFITRYGKDDYKPSSMLPYPTTEVGLPGEVFRSHILGTGVDRYQNGLFWDNDVNHDKEISDILYMLVCVRYIHPVLYEIDLSHISQTQTYTLKDYDVPFGSFVRFKFELGGKVYERYAMTDWKSYVHSIMADCVTRRVNLDNNFWCEESSDRFVVSNESLNGIKSVGDIRNLTLDDVTRIDKPYEHMTPNYFLTSKLSELRYSGSLDINMLNTVSVLYNGRIIEPMRDARNYKYKYHNMPTLKHNLESKDYKWMIAAAAGFVGGNMWNKLN